MKNVSPTTFRTEHLLALGTHAIHELAVRAAGTLTGYRLLLGRCLLALERSEGFVDYGCCDAIHYGCSVLGMEVRQAREFRRMARVLEGLPQLERLAELGGIDWSKLREVVRVASAESEAFWIEVCGKYPYAEVERLVRREQRKGEGEAVFSELRLQLTAEGMQLLQRAIRRVSEEAGRMLAPAEALEYLALEYLQQNRSEAAEDGWRDEAAAEERDCALVEQVECSVRNTAPWLVARGVEVAACPGNEGVLLAQSEKPHWRNPRLAFNPDSRLPTAAQRAEILRRDGYRCQTPGCSHQLFLHVHHIVFYSEYGNTTPDNLVVLCSACHRNVHQGVLRIEGCVGDLRFIDRDGRELGWKRRLEVGQWLDWHIGWKGGEHDSFTLRLAESAVGGALL